MQHLLKAGAALRSDQITEGFIQPGLENLQERRLSNLCPGDTDFPSLPNGAKF